jgi:hypothetical protein
LAIEDCGAAGKCKRCRRRFAGIYGVELMTNKLTAAETKADIEHVRAELVLTVHEIAKALAKRGGSLDVLGKVADDLTIEAARLRRLSAGKTA